ncbi:hypothetical protein PSSHI_27700 [Photobacterium sp. R1]
MLLERWVDMRDMNNKKLSGFILENRLLIDILFCLMAFILPFMMKMKWFESYLQTMNVCFIIEGFTAFYFLIIFIS